MLYFEGKWYGSNKIDFKNGLGNSYYFNFDGDNIYSNNSLELQDYEVVFMSEDKETLFVVGKEDYNDDFVIYSSKDAVNYTKEKIDFSQKI